VDESGRNKIIVGAPNHDGDGFGFPLKDLSQVRAGNEQYVDLKADEVSGACAKLIG